MWKILTVVIYKPQSLKDIRATIRTCSCLGLNLILIDPQVDYKPLVNNKMKSMINFEVFDNFRAFQSKYDFYRKVIFQSQIGLTMEEVDFYSEDILFFGFDAMDNEEIEKKEEDLIINLPIYNKNAELNISISMSCYYAFQNLNKKTKKYKTL